MCEGNRIGFAIHMAMTYGLSPGEICGLQWPDVDLQDHRLTVSRYAKETTVGRKRYVTDETYECSKKYGMTEETERLLADIKGGQLRLAEKGFQPEGDYVYLFGNGQRINPGWICYEFPEFLQQNGLKPIRFHDLKYRYGVFIKSKMQENTPEMV